MVPVAVAVVLAAPAPPRLADLLAEARAHNPKLAALEARERTAKSRATAAGALDDPMLMVELYQAPADFSSAPLMFELDQNLPLGGKRDARAAEAASVTDSAAAELEAATRDVEAEVAREYVDLFVASRTLDIDADVRRTLHEVADAAAARVVAGQAGEAESLEVESELVAVDAADEEAKAMREVAASRLAVALGESTPRSIEPIATPSPVALPSESSLVEKALASRPELARARAEVAAAEARLRLARADEVPDLGVVVGAMHVFGGAGETNMLTAGVRGNLPIFRRSKNTPRIDAASDEVDEAKAEELALRSQIAGEVAEGYSRVTLAARLVNLDRRQLPLARREVDAATSSYVAGKSDFVLLLDGVRRELAHELDLARHLADYERQLVALDRAVGAGLTLVAQSTGGVR